MNIIHKGLTLVVIIFFVSMNVIPSTGRVKEQTSTILSGDTLYVGGSGPGNYTKIQDAIDNAIDGDTVFVYSGIYYVSKFGINKSISLIGEDKNTTIIDGQEKNYIFDFRASWITLSGFTLQNTEEGAGVSLIIISNHWGPETNNNVITNNIFNDSSMNAIDMYNTNYNTVSNNIVVNCGWYHDCYFGIECGAPHNDNIITNNTLIGGAIFIWGVPKNDIIMDNYIRYKWILIDGGKNNTVNNNIIENGTDIFIDESKNNIVENNVLISSKSIVVRDSTQIKVSNNTFINSHGISIYGEKLDYWDTHIINNNMIDSKPIYYFNNKTGTVVPSNASQIIFSNSNSCYIENFTFKLGSGIQIGYSQNNIICNNEIINSLNSGISLQNSSQNWIVENVFSNNTNNGIELRGFSTENNINNNIIANNKNNGIELIEFSTDNNISENIISNNYNYGIFLSEESSCNVIYKNIIQGTHEDGIEFLSDSNIVLKNLVEDCINYGISCYGSFNNIFENNIADNSIGLWLSYGNFNKIIRNNFLNNTNLSIFFIVVYNFEFSNKWIENYYEYNSNRLIKIIWGIVQTRLGYWTEDIWGYRYWHWIMRPGINIDWHPTKEPYDIGG